MLGQCGGYLLNFVRIVDRVLAVVAGIRRFELLFGPVEVIIGFLDVVARAVKRIGEVVDRPGIPSLQLVIEFPRITTGRLAQLIYVQVDQTEWSHRRA